MTTRTARRIKETVPNLKGLRATKNNDPVNHPSHYTSHSSGIECIQITRHMSFCLGNALKYLWRAGQKNDLAEDLNKALFYVKDELREWLANPDKFIANEKAICDVVTDERTITRHYDNDYRRTAILFILAFAAEGSVRPVFRNCKKESYLNGAIAFIEAEIKEHDEK